MAISVYTSLLLKDYKRKAGEVKALRKDLRELAKMVLQKERELDALDKIIRTRAPDFDPSNIKSIATYPKVLGLKWNKLTTTILKCLHEANGTPVSSEAIKEYVALETGHAECSRAERMILYRSVQKRLKGLATAGKVVRHHSKNSCSAGIWSLPSGE